MVTLDAQGIESRKFFVGMHLQPSLRRYIGPSTEEFPVSESLSENGLYLPSSSHLTEPEIARICGVIANARRK